MNIVIVLMDTIIKTNLSKYCNTLLSTGILTMFITHNRNNKYPTARPRPRGGNSPASISHSIPTQAHQNKSKASNALVFITMVLTEIWLPASEQPYWIRNTKSWPRSRPDRKILYVTHK